MPHSPPRSRTRLTLTGTQPAACTRAAPPGCPTCRRCGVRRQASRFTELLAEIKQTFPQPFLISADVGVHGYTQGSYPLLVEPWVNVTMLNTGDIDFVNTMSCKNRSAPR